mmetsp:Transcript_11167/g.20301  ORF Transcript_11167/g.20301 Transcript_11167/m.20301 type:complete len:242 (-) Transcript_11167:8-733(-)
MKDTSAMFQPFALITESATSITSFANSSESLYQESWCCKYGPSSSILFNSFGEAATLWAKNSDVIRDGTFAPPLPHTDFTKTSLTYWASGTAALRNICPWHCAKIVHLLLFRPPCGSGSWALVGSCPSKTPTKRELEFSRNSQLNVAVSEHNLASPAEPKARKWKSPPFSSFSSWSFGSSSKHHFVSGVWAKSADVASGRSVEMKLSWKAVGILPLRVAGGDMCGTHSPFAVLEQHCLSQG